jgi:hypothetical protein
MHAHPMRYPHRHYDVRRGPDGKWSATFVSNWPHEPLGVSGSEYDAHVAANNHHWRTKCLALLDGIEALLNEAQKRINKLKSDDPTQKPLKP